jgi:DNA-binding transcriptional MerR regulator
MDPRPGAPPASLRIGELARRTGVSVELLRAWERRYGVLSPGRTAGGFRLYSDADEGRVRRMRRLIEGGLSAAEAARAALEEQEPAGTTAPADATPELERLAEALERALDGFDEPGAHAAVDALLSRFTVPTVLGRVLLPYLHRLGERWGAGEVSVGQEHFASGLVRGRLLGLARGWGAGDGPHAVLACPPGEHHDLALIMLGIGLARRGWRITFLGADTPVDTLVDAASSLRPDVVVLSGTDPRAFTAAGLALGALARSAPTAIAGPGATDDAVAALGVTRLDGDPVAAAEAIAGGWRPAAGPSG